MMTATRIKLILLGCLTLGGCADQPKARAVNWIGQDPARLAADEAYCRKDSDAVDVRQAAGYSDPRYGVTSAMANAIAQDNPLLDQRAAVREAAFEACMTDKGWKIQ